MSSNHAVIKKYAFILIAIVGLFAYINSFNDSFQFDDGYHIVDGTKIRNIHNMLTLNHWKAIDNRPFSFFTLAVDYQLAKKDNYGVPGVTGFHITNLIFHILAGFIAFLLALQIMSMPLFRKNKTIEKYKVLIALFSAFIFVAHPIQTQAVTYIIQRMTVLAGFFYMWAVLLYLRGRKAHLDKDETKAWKPWALYAGAFVAGVFAFLSKQNAASFPLAFILAEVLFVRNEEEKIDRKFLIGISTVVALIIAVGLLFQGGIPVEFDKISRTDYLLTQFRVMVKYWQLLFFPVNQHLDYFFMISNTLWGLKELTSLIFLLLTIALGIFLYRKKWYIAAFGIFWFYMTLSVESSIIPIRDVIFEHRLYMAVFGFGLAISYLAFYFLGTKKATNSVVALSLLTVIYIGASINRNAIWKTPYSLWSDSVKKDPKRERAWYWLATYYTQEKDRENAMKCYDESIKCNPAFPLAYNGRANQKKDNGDYDGALKDYNIAIQLDPKYVTAYYNRGITYSAMNRLNDAIENYDISIKLGNRSSAVYYNRGNVERRKHEYEAAIKDYNKAIQIDPLNPLCFLNRGLTKAAMHNHEDAIADIDKAIKIDPRNYLFYNGKGVSLIQLNKFNEAIRNFDQTIRLNPQFGQAYFNRGYARLNGLGDPNGACSDFKLAYAKGYDAAKNYIGKFCQ